MYAPSIKKERSIVWEIYDRDTAEKWAREDGRDKLTLTRRYQRACRDGNTEPQDSDTWHENNCNRLGLEYEYGTQPHRAIDENYNGVHCYPRHRY